MEAATAVCAECNSSVMLEEVVTIGEARVCAACKPRFLQKLAEGVPTAIQKGGQLPEKLVLRIAGVFMMLSAVAALAERAIFSSGGSPVSIVIDAFIAISFLRGNSKYKSLAILRVCIGVVALVVTSSGILGIVLPIVGYAGLIAILVGQPGRGRLIAGSCVFGLFLLLELVGLLFG